VSAQLCEQAVSLKSGQLGTAGRLHSGTLAFATIKDASRRIVSLRPVFRQPHDPIRLYEGYNNRECLLWYLDARPFGGGRSDCGPGFASGCKGQQSLVPLEWLPRRASHYRTTKQREVLTRSKVTEMKAGFEKRFWLAGSRVARGSYRSCLGSTAGLMCAAGSAVYLYLLVSTDEAGTKMRSFDCP
jgi:hypothetical protein